MKPCSFLVAYSPLSVKYAYVNTIPLSYTRECTKYTWYICKSVLMQTFMYEQSHLYYIILDMRKRIRQRIREKKQRNRAKKGTTKHTQTKQQGHDCFTSAKCE